MIQVNPPLNLFLISWPARCCPVFSSSQKCGHSVTYHSRYNPFTNFLKCGVWQDSSNDKHHQTNQSHTSINRVATEQRQLLHFFQSLAWVANQSFRHLLPNWSDTPIPYKSTDETMTYAGRIRTPRTSALLLWRRAVLRKFPFITDYVHYVSVRVSFVL